MADRFPSLEEFSEGQTETQGNSSLGIKGLDIDDDFLTRERAALGDDAAQFLTPGDNAGTSNAYDGGDNDLLGGGDAYGSGTTNGQESNFESSFPAIDTRNEHVAPGGTITGPTEPFQPRQPSYSNFQSTTEEEPEPIRVWREKRDAEIQRRDQISAEKKSETIKAAQGYIDDFYENYNRKKDKAVEQYRKDAETFLANREDTSAGGTAWDRISKMADLSGKGAKGGATGTSKEKMRKLLLGLKNDENAPGAKGF